MSELCKSCKTPMIVAKNKNGGYFATCPNKENHGGLKPVPPQPAAQPSRTVFGW